MIKVIDMDAAELMGKKLKALSRPMETILNVLLDYLKKKGVEAKLAGGWRGFY